MPVRVNVAVARACTLVLAVISVIACSDSRDKPPEIDAGSSLPDDTAGKACKRDADCAPGHCADELQLNASSTNTRAPGGYCTLECSRDEECGAGAECSVPAGAERGECLAGCADDSECREDYLCVGAGNVAALRLRGACQPKPKVEPVEDGVVGNACASAAECGGGQCAESSPVGTRLPGNYCTSRCFDDAECGTGGACLLLEGGGEAGHCYLGCGADEDCTREGYRCREIGPDFRACYPAPASLADFTAGKACATDDACGGAEGSCASELPFGSFADEMTTAPGGYCTQPCSLDTDCGQGAQCISRGVRGGLCMVNCNPPVTCREGYVCLPHGRDRREDEKVCFPASPE